MCNGSVRAEGGARVVDRLGIGVVPIGIESFADVAERFVYVDKTAVIADLIDRGGVTLFCRPRRFGKSLMLRTLQCFFEAPVEGWLESDPALFDGLAIMGRDRRHVAQRGAHPVIYLGLNACGGDTWESMKASIAQSVAMELNSTALTTSAMPAAQNTVSLCRQSVVARTQHCSLCRKPMHRLQGAVVRFRVGEGADGGA